MPTRSIGLEGRIGDAMDMIGASGVMQPTEAVRPETSNALQYYLNAAYQNEYYTRTGLSFYRNAIADSKEVIQQEYQRAIAELRPEQEASRSALAEMMRFTGIDPTPATTGMTDALEGIGQYVSTAKLNDLIRQAQDERDPNIRADLKAQVDAEFANVEQELSAYQKSEIEKRTGATGLPKPSYTGPLADAAPKKSDFGVTTFYPNSRVGRERLEAYKTALKDYNKKKTIHQDLLSKQMQGYQADKAAILSDIESTIGGGREELLNVKSKFQQDYKPEFDAAYTGAEVESKLRATPGYQFQERAGTKAIERAAAAKGMLGSANTLLALQQYGQDLASTYYQSHLQNLYQIAGQGSGASAQIANLYTGKAGLLSQIGQQEGAVNLEAYRGIGQAYTDAYHRIGEMEYDADKTYASQKFSGQESAKQRSLGVINQLIANEPAMRQADQQRAESQQMKMLADEMMDQEKQAAADERGFFRDMMAMQGQNTEVTSAVPGAKPFPGQATQGGGGGGGGGTQTDSGQAQGGGTGGISV